MMQDRAVLVQSVDLTSTARPVDKILAKIEQRSGYNKFRVATSNVTASYSLD